MMIDFQSMPDTILPKFKGGEGQLVAKMLGDDLNRILYATLAPGHSIGLHTHDTSSEIMYFLSGHGTVTVDGVAETVSAGLCHYCPKGSAHTLVNDGEEELVFFAVVPQQ
jgi:mannose-6-phosphate isomerase-like protein (cupin superfamily)